MTTAVTVYVPCGTVLESHCSAAVQLSAASTFGSLLAVPSIMFAAGPLSFHRTHPPPLSLLASTWDPKPPEESGARAGRSLSHPPALAPPPPHHPQSLSHHVTTPALHPP